MKVLMLPADDAGCGHYRMKYPAQALMAAGEPVDIRFDDKLPVTRALHDPRMITKVGKVDADIVVLQRPLKAELAQMVPMLKRKGITVVVDVDDDFMHLHPAHSVFKRYHPKYSPFENFRWLQKACGAADLVTVSTPALADRYGSHGRVAVLPNCIPAEWLEWRGQREPRGWPTVGWSGFVSSHPGDLQVTQGGVAEALDRSGARWLTIGDGQGVPEALGLIPRPNAAFPNIEATGPVEFKRYMFKLQMLDVGIVPLHASVFNDAKSWLKGLEYAALGIPFVASATAHEYAKLARDHGVGLLARPKRKHWARGVERLLDPVAAEPFVDCGRAWAMEQTYDRHAWRWAEAWTAAWTGRTRRVRGVPSAGVGR